MKSELYRSVSWLGSNGRTYLTHSGGRYLLLGIAAIFAAFLSLQALAPAPTFAQEEGDGSSAESRLVIESGGECSANPDKNNGLAYYETTVFDSTTPDDVIVTIRGCGTTPDNSFRADAPATTAAFLTGDMDGADHALFELKDVSAAQETALGTEVARNLHLKAGSELVADQVYNVSVKLSQVQETLDGLVSGSKTVMVTVHLKINIKVSLAANPNWRPGFTQVPADGSRTARLSDAFTTGGNIELTYTVESSRTVIARARIIGTTARVDGISGGQAEITVTATAPNGSTATQTFPVRVREDLQPDPTPTPAPPTATPLPPVVTDTPTPPTPTATPVPPTATATATPRPTDTPEPSATPTVIPTIAPPAPPTDTPTGPEPPGLSIAPFIVGLIILALLGVGAFLLLRRRGGGESPEGGPDDGMGSDDDMLDDGGMDDDDADMDMEEDAADQDEAEEDGDGDGEDGDDDEEGDADGDEEEEERQ